MTQGILFSVSGLAGARVKELYKVLSAALPEAFPSRQVTALGCPFCLKGRRKYPFPLLSDEVERGLHPTTDLLSCWKRLNEFTVRVLRTALSENEIVLVERFGLDAFLYAAAYAKNEQELKEVEQMHHGALVPMRVVGQSIPPPVYLIPVANAENAAENLILAFPALKERSRPEALRAFAEREGQMFDRYFAPEHKQRTPLFLPTSMSTDEMVRQCIITIGNRLLQAEQTAA